ncbi:DNA-protecting protein DprA [Patescibacteria group bacterium]|nr:DNA-protecting protein DprA [Patescibacteria group bacterium]
MAESLATDLVLSGMTIVSGLARGVDRVAHRSALKAGGRTIAVLGSGFNRLYPAEHHGLACEIAGGGGGSCLRISTRSSTPSVSVSSPKQNYLGSKSRSGRG